MNIQVRRECSTPALDVLTLTLLKYYLFSLAEILTLKRLLQILSIRLKISFSCSNYAVIMLKMVCVRV